MPLNDLSDDDSFHVKPPRLSIALNDDDITTRSLEANRRATVDTIPRLSLGSTRLSERFADLNELGIDAASILDEAGNVTVDDDTARDLLEQAGFDVDVLLEEDTQDVQAFAEALRRGGRHSDIGVGAGQEVEDDTFRFVVPDRARFMREQREAEEKEDDQAEEEATEEQIPPLDGLDDAEAEDQLDEETADADDAHERTLREDSITAAERPQADPMKPTAKSAKHRRKELKVSKHGIEYPSLPPTVVKRLATTFLRSAGNGNAKINKETLDAIVQTSDWFFEQIGEDLESYADHAGRRTIDEGDVVTLMKRQRLLNANTTPFSLAQKFLSRELLQEIRMPTPAKSKKAKKRRMETIDEEESVG
ncbi:hypothetical protein H2199_005446 [Coniosporium tulheliwenetii]|uniref:Uncharacterized protein n=1 Tax=Coniosporium tulheliwenetii TaxID=3383036 RepID=A0ACC2Z1M6_9PEZI|nr:hypothetical protein H2199_005446 [Cladosporium sp. JES 115]